MSTGQKNRKSAVRRTLPLLILSLTIVVLGCGGNDEPEAADPATAEAMVPVTADSSTSLGIESLESDVTAEMPTVTREQPVDREVAPAAAEVKAAAKAVEEPAAKTARSPVNEVSRPADGSGLSLQLGSFKSAENAEAQAARIRELGHEPVVEVATLGGETYHRVVLSGLSDRAAAEKLGEEIRSRLGITYLIRQK